MASYLDETCNYMHHNNSFCMTCLLLNPMVKTTRGRILQQGTVAAHDFRTKKCLTETSQNNNEVKYNWNNHLTLAWVTRSESKIEARTQRMAVKRDVIAGNACSGLPLLLLTAQESLSSPLLILNLHASTGVIYHRLELSQIFWTANAF